MLAAILVAGLWPFRVPPNQVRWGREGRGLEFGRRGIVISRGDFHAVPADRGCTIEVLLRPADPAGTDTILAFDSSPDPRFPFAIRQDGDGVTVQRGGRGANGKMIRPWLPVHHALTSGATSLLVITGNGRETVVYANGMPLQVSRSFGLVSADLTGKLILGSSTRGGGWQGEIDDVVLYRQALSPQQVSRQFAQWKHGGSLGLLAGLSPAAAYPFDAGKGRVIHSVGGGPDLMIPDRYREADPAFLDPLWKPFISRWDGGMTWSYWSDVLVNIAGFIPMGSLFTAYFALARPLGRARWMTVLLGFCLSLSIEVLQYFLPTRDSSMTDLTTNTIGAILGAIAVQPRLLRAMAAVVERAGRIFHVGAPGQTTAELEGTTIPR